MPVLYIEGNDCNRLVNDVYCNKWINVVDRYYLPLLPTAVKDDIAMNIIHLPMARKADRIAALSCILMELLDNDRMKQYRVIAL